MVSGYDFLPLLRRWATARRAYRGAGAVKQMKLTHTKHDKFTDSLSEVVKSLIPIMSIIVLLMLAMTFVFDLPDDQKVKPEHWIRFAGGAVMVILGMSLFLYGSGKSMMKFGAEAGGYIFGKGKLLLILGFGFFLGYLVTNAEPDLLVLARQVNGVDSAIGKTMLISSISVGTGIFLSIALYRVVKKIRFIKVVLVSYALIFAFAIGEMFMTDIVASLANNKPMIALAFDSSGVTTGPVTVPFILSFAAGAAGMLKDEDEQSGNASFGMVGITSVGAIIAVLILGVFFHV
jgi:hypothetical protein